MTNYTIKIRKNEEGVYEAIAFLPHNKIKGIVGITHDEVITKARLSILKFLITTRKEPLIIIENNQWLISGNFAAQKILGDTNPRKFKLHSQFQVIKEYRIPQTIQIARIVDH
jgi:hypothetical protein